MHACNFSIQSNMPKKCIHFKKIIIFLFGTISIFMSIEIVFFCEINLLMFIYFSNEFTMSFFEEHWPTKILISLIKNNSQKYRPSEIHLYVLPLAILWCLFSAKKMWVLKMTWQKALITDSLLKQKLTLNRLILDVSHLSYGIETGKGKKTNHASICVHIGLNRTYISM